MSYWTFSPSSEPYLQRCIAAALLQQNDNKWTQKFGHKNSKHINITSLAEEQTVVSVSEVISVAPSPEHENNEVTFNYEEFFDVIENEIRLDVIAKECSEHPDLMLKMAERLSSHVVEKLFEHIFVSKDLDISFLTGLFYNFLPTYIKHQYSWLCIDLLVKTNDVYSELFPKLIKVLIEDTEIPNNIIHNYVSTLSSEKLVQFMENLTNIELSSENFIRNILTIYTAYKDCEKTAKIQNYICSNLLQHSTVCASERNYGRLFLMYLQAEKTLDHTVNVKRLEECLELHRSPFKRPCVMLLKEFIENE